MYQQAKTDYYCNLFSKKDIFLALSISFGYLLLSYLLIGFRFEQLVLVAICNALYFASYTTRKLMTGFSVFVLYWVIFDYMKAFPNFKYNPVHIASLFEAEKEIFGFRYLGELVTPNQYWLLNKSAVLDVISGFFYLCWVPVPLAFAMYLFFSEKYAAFMHFALTFLLVNVLGFIVYYIYPAAPPWYVEKYGFTFLPNTGGEIAGLQGFDTFFNIGVFKALYAKSSNVFAAMPSLHSSYPIITLFYGIKYRLGKVNWLFAAIVAGIWFAAVYTTHHYVLDVVAGVFCAACGILLYQLLIAPNKTFKRQVITRFVES